MAEKAYVDFETASAALIRKVGSRRYLLDSTTDILMMAWWIRSEMARPKLWWPGQPFPARLKAHLDRGGLLSGWNAIEFERVAWGHLCVPCHGFPPVDDGVWRDTMHKAAAANLPRSLDGAAKAVGASVQKDKDGHNLMIRITNKVRTPVIKPEELQRLGVYCIGDAETEATTDDRIIEWPNIWPWSEMPRVDREINDRGILMDVELVRGLAKAAADELVRLDIEMGEVTGDKTIKTSSVGKIKQWLLDQGVKLPEIDPEVEDEEESEEDKDEDGARDTLKRYRMRKSDIADLLADKTLSNSVRYVLEMRAEAAKASTKKLKAMMLYVDPDGRLRGAFKLMGAQATGRYSGVGWQPHNFVRVVIPDQQLLGAIYDGRTGDANYIRSLWGNVLPWASKMLRRCLCAPLGRTLLQGDFAQVEARITAWLAGQHNIVDAFAHGEDVYRLAAALILGKRPEDITKEERQLGKIAVLGLGFGGGANVFIVMGLAYDIRMSHDEASPIVKAWRKSNEMIVQLWGDCENAIKAAIANPSYEYRVGDYGVDGPKKPMLVSYFVQNDCLHARLPSGRFLRYWAPRLQDEYWPDGNYRGKGVTYLKVKGSTVYRAKLYGGLAVENLAQAIAADLLVGALVRLTDAGFEVALHVHDSVAAEIDEDKAEAALPHFQAVMAQVPYWAKGLPIGADCHIGSRFG